MFVNYFFISGDTSQDAKQWLHSVIVQGFSNHPTTTSNIPHVKVIPVEGQSPSYSQNAPGSPHRLQSRCKLRAKGFVKWDPSVKDTEDKQASTEATPAETQNRDSDGQLETKNMDVISDEDAIKDAQNIARRLVAVALANAMAKHIEEETQGDETDTVHAAQAAAAKATAEAAAATQNGDPKAAALAVVAAADAVKNVAAENRNRRSKFCTVL